MIATPELSATIRRCVRFALFIGVLVFAAGLMPGYEYWVPPSDCEYENCVRIVTHREPAARPLELILLGIALAPAIVVWRQPRFGRVLLWSLWSAALTIVYVALVFRAEPEQVETLWPSEATYGLGVVLAGFLCFAMPLVVFVVGVEAEERAREGTSELPAARLR